MVIGLGRLPRWAVALSSFLSCLALQGPQASRAQDWDDEVIVDPELAGSSSSAGGDSGEEVILDPELDGTPAGGSGAAPEGFEGGTGWGNVYEAPAMEDGDEGGFVSSAGDYDPQANTGIAKLEVASQVGFDLHHEGKTDPALALEDAYEMRLRFGGEIEFRRSRTLRLVVGSRIDMLWAVPSQNDAYVAFRGQRALDQDRFEVDVIPTAAYVDWTAFDGGHLRVGHQVLSLSRMDFVSSTDALAIYDLRPQPTLNPAAVQLAQPAIRFDWDITTAVTLKLAYVPWFSPNLMRPDRDKYKTTVLAGPGTASLPEDLEGIIDPAFQTQSAQANVRFVGPAPDFTTPQGQAWLGFRTRLVELGLTGAAALEKMPSYYYTPDVERFLLCDPYAPDNLDMEGLSDCDVLKTRLGGLNFNGLPLFDAQFHRYFMVGADAAFDAGPVSMAVEGSFSPQRQLYAASADGSRLPLPNVTEPILEYAASCANLENAPDSCLTDNNLLDESIRRGVPVLQGGLHAEYLRGESLILVGEFFWSQALKLPYDRSRQWLGYKRNLAALYGGALAVSYLSGDGMWRLDLSLLTLTGPSIALMPHVELRVMQGLYVDAGVQIIEGPNPGVNGSTKLNFGGLNSGSDQVFLGMRWLP